MPENNKSNTENRNNRNNRNNRSNRNNRRGRYRDRRRNDRNRNHRENREYVKCAICERDIRDISSAIALKESGLPAHFDCILKQIADTESIAQHEKVCYLGKGSFGIVRFQRMGGIIPFVIRKRIQYEEFDETPDWRKDLNKYKAAHPLYKPAEADKTE